MELIPIITRWKPELYRRTGGACYGWMTADGSRFITFNLQEQASSELEAGYISDSLHWMLRSDLSPDRELIPLEKKP